MLAQVYAQKNTGYKFPKLKGDYFGQKTPGKDAVLFAPGLISTGNFERDFSMTPDGKEIYYSTIFGGNKYVTIMVTKNVNGVWTEPMAAPFATDFNYYCMEPHIQPDGKRILFLSTRPVPGQPNKPGWGNQNTWICDRKDDGSWSEPYYLDIKDASTSFNYFPSVAKNGTVYFTRNKPGSQSPKIYRVKSENNKYRDPEVLPSPVNGEWQIFNAFIAPDESYLIACVSGHPANTSKGIIEYLIFFRNENDKWSQGINMGSKINFPEVNASSPYVSPDGKYVFFSADKQPLKDNKPITLEFIKKAAVSPENGTSDIYWVKSDFIKELKTKAVFN